MHRYRMWNSRLSDSKLNMCDVATKSTSVILVYIHRGIISKPQKVVIPFCSALIRPHLDFSVQFYVLHFNNNSEKLEQVERRTMRISRRLETISFEERLQDLGMFNLKKREQYDSSLQITERVAWKKIHSLLSFLPKYRTE